MSNNKNGKTRVALVNQRYGMEVIGGSEYYTRLIAEHLQAFYQVEVLTTTALDHVTWANHYPPGPQMVGSVLVRRFPVGSRYNPQRFVSIDQMLMGNTGTETLCDNWIMERGPVCPELLSYLSEHQDEYDLFLFVTYLYYPAVKGIPLVAEKALFIPTAHDERYIYWPIYPHVFQSVRALLYLTPEEKAFVEGQFDIQNKPSAIAGVGIDIPGGLDVQAFREKHGIQGDYLVYVGRIEEGKGCGYLLNYFQEYLMRTGRDLTLVLMGKEVMKIPRHKRIRALGLVSEEDKFSGLMGAKALVLPSAFESLSIAVLEAMSLSTPVLVNGACSVLKGHCQRSQAGLYYENYFEFEGILSYMLDHPGAYAEMKLNAKQYIKENYRWEKVMQIFRNMIDMLCPVINLPEQ